MKKVLVCGDRNWVDWGIIRSVLRKLKEDGYTHLVHGACRGADLIGKAIGEELGFVIEDYPAQWDKHGRAAGPIRNRQMLKEGKPDFVAAFHNDLDSSKGTKDMVEAAANAGVAYMVYNDSYDGG